MDIYPGFWRIDNLSDVIIPCINREANCLGGVTNFTCKRGNIGALCESCDLKPEVWDEKFG